MPVQRPNISDQPDQPIRPVGSGLADSPEAQALAASEQTAIPSVPEVEAQTLPQEASLDPALEPVTVPVAVPVMAAPVAIAVATPAAANEGQYSTAGSLTAEQVIAGDPNRYAHLDEGIADLVNKVQDSLIDLGMADRLPEARFDADLRAFFEKEIDRLALNFFMQNRFGGAGDTQVIIAMVVNEIIGLGPLEPLWQDSAISEVIVNGPTDVYVERAGRLTRASGVRFRSADHLLDVSQKILSPLNRKLDVKDPLADGRLPDGSRVNAVHHAVAPKGPLLTIRRFPQVNRNLVDLVGMGAMSQDMSCLVSWLVANKASTLVVGGTGTGKTTMLNALSAAIPREERVITIEDSLELRLSPENHVAAMEARPTDASGGNAVTIRALVKNALRMRPDRIIVGEIRDQAALDMLQACNTGHEGSMSTVHANGANEAIARLTVMVAQGGEIPADKVDWLVGSALDLIIVLRRYKDGSRRVSGVYEVPESDAMPAGQSLRTIPLWEWQRSGEDENGKLIGDYVQVNEISQPLRDKLGLDFEPKFTWDDVRNLSGTV